MKGLALLLSLLVGASAAVAGDLRGSSSGRGLAITGALGRLDSEARREPREALHDVALARRWLDGDTSIEADRFERRLDDIQRDADRSLRRQASAVDLGWLTSGRDGLPTPDIALPPTPRDIRGDDSVLGTGKAFIRIGRLLDRSAIVGASAVAEASQLLEGALRADSTIAADDAQVVATRARIAQLATVSPAFPP